MGDATERTGNMQRTDTYDGPAARAVVLVEGTSDRAALLTVARRLGRDLASERVEIVAMGGAGGLGEHLSALAGTGIQVSGLCDEGEVATFGRGLERAGLGAPRSLRELEALGFAVCVEDLEDELIRAVGLAAVLECVRAEGDSRSLETMRRQPAWRGRPPEQQLRRFIGAGAGRKLRYARRLAAAAEIDRLPRPLTQVLARVAPG